MARSTKKVKGLVYPVTRQSWEVKVKVWERMALGETDSAIERWSQVELPELEHGLNRGTAKRMRGELLVIPDHLLSHLPDPVKALRDEWLQVRRDADSDKVPSVIAVRNKPLQQEHSTIAIAINPSAIAPNLNSGGTAVPRSPLWLNGLNVKNPKVVQERRPFSVGVRTLTAAVEVTATAFVEDLRFALVMGGTPISEELQPGEPPKELLGKATYRPVFRIPGGVSAGPHRVEIGAWHQDTGYITRIDYSTPSLPRLIKSSAFEVRVPKLRTLTPAEEALIAAEKAAKEACQRLNRAHNVLAQGVDGAALGPGIDYAESEKATEVLRAAKKALEEARQRVIREDGAFDLGSYGHGSHPIDCYNL